MWKSRILAMIPLINLLISMISIVLINISEFEGIFAIILIAEIFFSPIPNLICGLLACIFAKETWVRILSIIEMIFSALHGAIGLFLIYHVGASV